MSSHTKQGLSDLRDEIATRPDDEAVLICTGSQGEPMAVLSRIANRDHAISVGPDDTVILASSLIPGNENSVNRVINGLSKLGATIVHATIFMGLYVLLGVRTFASPWQAVMGQAIGNSIVGMVAFTVVEALPGMIERRRLSRRTKH